jgi:hypothetical protein
MIDLSPVVVVINNAHRRQISMIIKPITIRKMMITLRHPLDLMARNDLGSGSLMPVIDVEKERFDVIPIIHVDRAKQPRMNVLSILHLDDLPNPKVVQKGRDRVVLLASRDHILQSRIKRHWKLD